MDIIHIKDNITDYVLDLLSAEERQVVAQHIASCDTCREAVQREREIGHLVHQTLSSVTKPEYNRLQSLMPPIPKRRLPILALLMPRLNPFRQWAVACLLLVAMMGAFLFGSDGRFNNLAQPVDSSQATLSSLNHPGTADVMSTMEAGTLFTIAAQESVQRSVPADDSPEANNPTPVPLPAAPQATPAPEATYFQ